MHCCSIITVLYTIYYTHAHTYADLGKQGRQKFVVETVYDHFV